QCTLKVLPIALVLVQKDITHLAKFLQPSISAVTSIQTHQAFSLTVYVCGCTCGREREMEHIMSVMFVRCRNSSLLRVFSTLEAHICYFKHPGSLHRIQT
ncbi:hypothetical protein CIB84_015995, partial [Bambusicola thoracicus]